MAQRQLNLKNAKDKLDKKDDDTPGSVESSDSPFLYNGRFSVLAVSCSLPLLYFGGERLFGIAALCLLVVYIFHLSFEDSKSSVISFLICVAVLQFSILYSIGPLLWQSFFNIIFLLLYNLFIVLTAGFGLIQFEAFHREEIKFCANVEYFLFLVYPPCCVLILMWLISLSLGVYLAPYLIIILGFPTCHTFLDQKLKPSFETKSDHVLGQPEKILALFNFVFAPSFVYCLINFSNLLHYASWVSVFFCMCVPLFLVTFLDTTDIRDMADIQNSQWKIVQIFTGFLSLILGSILAYIHGAVDGINAVFLGVILLCATAVFITVKYRYSKMVSYISCGLLLTSYLVWFTTLPWNLVFSMGSEITLSSFTLQLLVLLLGILSVLALTISLSVRYKAYLNQVLILHTFGFVLLEVLLVDSDVYSPFLIILTGVSILYLLQRLHQVGYLKRTPSLVCMSLHGSKLLLVFTSFNIEGTLPTFAGWSALLVAFGGFGLCSTLSNVLLFEHGKQLDNDKILEYIGMLFLSLVVLSSSFLQKLCILLTHNNPSVADIVGLILFLTGACFAKLAFLHSDDQAARKQSILVLFVGVLTTLLQPYFNIFEVFVHTPKLIFREAIFETWQVVFAEYVILPWCMLISFTIILVITLKLASPQKIPLFSLNIISVLIGAPTGLYVAHLVLPYPNIPSSFLSIPYVISAVITANSFLLAVKGPFGSSSVKMYTFFLITSIISVVDEISNGIRTNLFQDEVPPSVIYQGCLHLLTIIQEQPAHSNLQNSLEKRISSFPNVRRNFSVFLLFSCGLVFAPGDYYDILLVPVCGLLLMLRIKDIVRINNEEEVLRRVLFTGVLGSMLYYRVLVQLPWAGKWNFWTGVAFILEMSIVTSSFLVFLIMLSVLWHQSIRPNEELALAVFAPLFTIMLFYGRTAAGLVLGLVGPALAYTTFQISRTGNL